MNILIDSNTEFWVRCYVLICYTYCVKQKPEICNLRKLLFLLHKQEYIMESFQV